MKVRGRSISSRFCSVWFMGEDNSSTWAALGVLGKKLSGKFKVDSFVMSVKSRFNQQESLFRFDLFTILPSEMRLFILSWRFPLVISSKSTVFIIWAWIQPMSARFDCCFHLAIMTKILLSNAESCPDVIVVAASDICCGLLLGFRVLLCSRTLIMGSELCLVSCMLYQ